MDVFRPGGVSYLRIPATDEQISAAFYTAVFGWEISPTKSFQDGSGHVIGHFRTDLDVVGEAGIVPYIYVDSVDQTLERIAAHGGAQVAARYPEGDLLVATFRDPAGNVLGIWQRATPT